MDQDSRWFGPGLRRSHYLFQHGPLYTFIRDICLGDCCFICGAKPGSRDFNNEHIFPEWLLRRFNLFDKTISLPNGVAVRYDRYVVPCCAQCNSLMGDELEGEISEVVRSGATAINEFVLNGNFLRLFVWVALIYLKTHLKDRLYRRHLDARKGDEKIADEYDWALLHHLHCLARTFYMRCEVEQEAIGSFLILPVNTTHMDDNFDYGDFYFAQTMLLRLGDLGMIAVFDDSGGALNYFTRKLDRITPPVSTMQLREIMVELAWLNLHLKERPTFHSELDLYKEECRIVAVRPPTLSLNKLDGQLRGKLLRHVFDLDQMNLGRPKEQVQKAVDDGLFTFLFDDEGNFIKESWYRLKT